jgi:DNA-binding transcriptional LysR family regulator
MLAQADWPCQGKRVAHAGLFLVRGAYPDIVAEFARDRFEDFEAGGVDAVIVGQEDFHRAVASSFVIPPI